MSGPNSEFAPLHVQPRVDVAFWPLRMLADRGEGHVECAQGDSGDLLVAQVRGKEFMLADLTARFEEHVAKCTGVRDES
jgi:hypothetical protein